MRIEMRIRLYKIYPKPVTNHIYEHLFVTTMWRYFDSKGLINGIDYSYTATAFHGGLICLDLDLYSLDAQNLVPQISKLNVSTDKNSLISAITEVCAENEQRFSGNQSDLDALENDIAVLNSITWDDIENTEVITMKNIKLHKNGDLSLKDMASSSFSNALMSVSVASDFIKHNKSLVPLIKIIQGLLVRRLGYEVIPETLGWYAYDFTTDQAASYVHLHARKTAEVDASVAMRACKKYLKTYITDEYVSDLQSKLSKINADTYFNLDHYGLYEDHNIIFGQKYLQSTDVLSSIDTVLENIVVKVSYRGKKIEESLSSRIITK
jgi:hypothetical protein